MIRIFSHLVKRQATKKIVSEAVSANFACERCVSQFVHKENNCNKRCYGINVSWYIQAQRNILSPLQPQEQTIAPSSKILNLTINGC